MFEMKINVELTAAPDLLQAVILLVEAVKSEEVIPVQEPKKAKKPAKKKAAEQPVATPVQEAPAEVEAPKAAEPLPTTPAVPEPVKEEPKPIDMAAISRAGASLVDQGKMPEIMALLKKYNVQAITQLTPEQVQMIAEDFRDLGADI